MGRFILICKNDINLVRQTTKEVCKTVCSKLRTFELHILAEQYEATTQLSRALFTSFLSSSKPH